MKIPQKKYAPHPAHKQGFTLIEISIVLVIVGLIIGGILVGREMIKASEIRATVKQVEQFDTAFNTFKLKYGCISGDCKNAEQFGFTSAYSPHPALVQGSNENGDGDGMIKHSGGSDSQDEYLTAFWWLQNAGLINNVREDGLWGSFSVVPTVIAGGNSNGGNAHWKVLWFDVGSPTASPDNQYFSDANAGAGHYYWLTNYLNYTVILPVEAQAIDSKLDDGLPRSGKVLAGNYDGAEGGNGDSSLPIFDASGEGFGDGLPQSGPAGATSDYCITNDTTPKYNILNTSRHDGSYGAGSSISSLCTLTVKASF